MELLPALAKQSGLFAFYVNQAGFSGGDKWGDGDSFPGLACAFDPRGRLIAEHNPNESGSVDGMIVAEVSRKLLTSVGDSSAPASDAKAKPVLNSSKKPVRICLVPDTPEPKTDRDEQQRETER